MQWKEDNRRDWEYNLDTYNTMILIEATEFNLQHYAAYIIVFFFASFCLNCFNSFLSVLLYKD